MAVRARLTPPRPQQETWPWHHAKHATVSASVLMGGDRRMEAEAYLAGGYGIRLALEARRAGWRPFETMARVWQPNRLKGTLVSPEFGTPFLAATQVFDLRPSPRKFLSLDHTANASQRFVDPGTILVTCSGSVGRATLAHKPHEGVLISHDLLRVEARLPEAWGWTYAFLRSPQARAMMNAAQYGHIIKHLEASHLNALPIPIIRDGLMKDFNDRVQNLLDKRNQVVRLLAAAEDAFAATIGEIPPAPEAEIGFAVKASDLFGQRRRLEAAYHGPFAAAVAERLSRIGTEPLAEVTERIWWMTRFKRVFGDGGMPYMSADELFSLNPSGTKRVMVDPASGHEGYGVKAGWIMMACSGQVYGLNGSVALMTRSHEDIFFSHDLIRIVPKAGRIRPGYLLTALGHPVLGRPLVIRNAYGTSIPHLEPADLCSFPVVRLPKDVEDRIADHAEQSALLRAEADEIENALAAEAERLIDRFLAGNSADFVIS